MTTSIELIDLSWVEFSEEDRPDCNSLNCSKEAISQIHVFGECQCGPFSYCSKHIGPFSEELRKSLNCFGTVFHYECIKVIFDFKVTSI